MPPYMYLEDFLQVRLPMDDLGTPPLARAKTLNDGSLEDILSWEFYLYDSPPMFRTFDLALRARRFEKFDVDVSEM